MDRLDLDEISVPDAQLVQHGLSALGFYSGTKRGIPGVKTKAAYDKFRASFGVPKEDITPPPTGESIADALVRILSAETGVREVPRNSNRGKRVEEYQAATWLPGSGWPWCAAFICWGLLQVDREKKLPFARPQTAGAWDFENWARSQSGKGVSLFKPRQKVRKGDIVVFTFSHIGLAIADEANGYVATVEGNTDSSGSREGGGVYKKHRAASLVRSHIRIA